MLSTENADFGSNPICDSIKLFLDYNQYYYGDTLESQSLEVYKVTDIMDDSSYTSNSSLNVDASMLGSSDAGFVARPTTGDSIVEINLVASYGDEIIAAANTTNDLFVQTINGLSIKPQAGVYDGCIMGFLASSDSKVILYYTNDAGSSSYTLDINTTSKRFNSISADRSSTVLSSLASPGDSISTTALSNEGYLQAGTGIATKLTFPTLINLTDSLGDIALNRAEIVIYPVDGSITGDHDEAPLFLSMVETDESNLMLENSDGTFKVIPNDFYTVNNAGIQEFNYDEDCECYKLRLTNYFQDLIFENQDNNGVLLIPTINSTRVTRCLFYDNDNLVNPGKSLKLNLYYTKLGNQ